MRIERTGPNDFTMEAATRDEVAYGMLLFMEALEDTHHGVVEFSSWSGSFTKERITPRNLSVGQEGYFWCNHWELGSVFPQ